MQWNGLPSGYTIGISAGRGRSLAYRTSVFAVAYLIS
jgi:hypothetical protein